MAQAHLCRRRVVARARAGYHDGAASRLDMAGFRDDLHEDLQLHILLFSDLESVLAVKATCLTLCHLSTCVLDNYHWIERGRNRVDLRCMRWREVDLRAHLQRITTAVGGARSPPRK